MITDMVMPGLSGLAAAKVLKQTRPETAVLYMSGYPLQMVEEASTATAFIRKPFTPEELMQKVYETLSKLVT